MHKLCVGDGYFFNGDNANDTIMVIWVKKIANLK